MTNGHELYVRRLFALDSKLLCDCFKYLLKRSHFWLHELSWRNFEVLTKHMKVLKVLLKWNWWWNFTCVCTIFLLTLKFIFSSSYWKSFLVLFQAINYIFSFYKMQIYWYEIFDAKNWNCAIMKWEFYELRSCSKFNPLQCTYLLYSSFILSTICEMKVQTILLLFIKQCL